MSNPNFTAIVTNDDKNMKAYPIIDKIAKDLGYLDKHSFLYTIEPLLGIDVDSILWLYDTLDYNETLSSIQADITYAKKQEEYIIQC